MTDKMDSRPFDDRNEDPLDTEDIARAQSKVEALRYPLSEVAGKLFEMALVQDEKLWSLCEEAIKEAGEIEVVLEEFRLAEMAKTKIEEAKGRELSTTEVLEELRAEGITPTPTFRKERLASFALTLAEDVLGWDEQVRFFAKAAGKESDFRTREEFQEAERLLLKIFSRVKEKVFEKSEGEEELLAAYKEAVRELFADEASFARFLRGGLTLAAEAKIEVNKISASFPSADPRLPFEIGLDCSLAAEELKNRLVHRFAWYIFA